MKDTGLCPARRLLIVKWARLLAVLALSAALVGLYHWIRHGGIVVGRAEVQSQWDA